MHGHSILRTTTAKVNERTTNKPKEMKKLTIEVPEGAEITINGKPYKHEEDLKKIYFECTSEEMLNHYSQFTESNLQGDWILGNIFVASDWMNNNYSVLTHKLNILNRTKVTEEEFVAEMHRRGLTEWTVYNPEPKFYELPEGAPVIISEQPGTYIKIGDQDWFGYNEYFKRWKRTNTYGISNDSNVVLVKGTFADAPIGSFVIEDLEEFAIAEWYLKTKKKSSHWYGQVLDEVAKSTWGDLKEEVYYTVPRSEFENE